MCFTGVRLDKQIEEYSPHPLKTPHVCSSHALYHGAKEPHLHPNKIDAYGRIKMNAHECY